MSAGSVREQAQRAREAARRLRNASTLEKNAALLAMADALEADVDKILAANREDVEAAEAKGTSKALIDRLTLNRERVAAAANGLREVAALPDPVGVTVSMARRPNGMEVGRVRVPLGVVAIIYEARPNVTIDAAGLCLKAGNAVILRGGSDAFRSNKAIVDVMRGALQKTSLPEQSIQMVEDTSRASAEELMQLTGLVDVLIPRGGRGLIQSVVQNAKVPVIQTGEGNCHIFVDEDADLEQAVNIVVNAKCQRPGVCNAVETLLVHRAVAEKFLPKVAEELRNRGVTIRGCSEARAVVPWLEAADESDWETEYLDLILAVKVVGSLDEAVEHIERYGTGHSEAILTSNYNNARRFLEAVDAAAVYVNASTRFTDGGQFGLGAEIGISTQKLHARGPMGLEELTTTKYVIYGGGQIRS
ncbi:MAG TPA: glutamate-5-semialdehyde dehydrogenase [Firmicutes bacterium]|nr:glutamate-5-semialdehyde dehydrogenase [Bacillota bacterium]